MSLLDKASLIVTPNAYKTSKLYSVVPNTTLGDMDVVRATTAIRVNSSSLIESVGVNIPRIDYTNGSCPSLLVEPQRTNLVIYSEEIDNVAWIKLNSLVTANSIISPSGLLNADTVIANGGTSLHIVQTNSISFTTGISYSLSVFAKKGTNDFIQLITSLSIGGMFANFNLNTGVVGTLGTVTGTTPTSLITNYGNGWYRCTINFTANATTSQLLNIALVTSASAARGETNALTTSVYLYGAQLEVGSYPTSYIPTVASSITRNADVISKTGISSLIGQTEGTVFVDLNFNNLASKTEVNRIIELTDGTNANRIIIAFGSTNAILTRVTSSGSEQASFNASVSLGRLKIAYSYSANGVKLFVNGILIQSNLSAIIPTTSRINLGYQGTTGTQQLNDSINSSQLYKTSLTNAECIALTIL